jgi:hypothetical protein
VRLPPWACRTRRGANARGDFRGWLEARTQADLLVQILRAKISTKLCLVTENENWKRTITTGTIGVNAR